MDFSKKRKAEENGNGITTSPTLNLTPEDARRLLHPLTHDQLLDILQNAVVRHPDVLDAVRSLANRDTTLRKLFVRGLGAETTSESLRSLFASYGDLDEAIVIFDKNTGKSKGYGFVTFKNADGALLALKEPSKKIDGRITVTQFAAAGLSGHNSASAGAGDVSARKIYVGNVPFDIPSERLLSHFSMYGEIEEGPLGFDKATGKSKGFAFFVYKTEDGARTALVDPIKNIDGHQVACKLAVDNKKTKVGGQISTGFNTPPPHSSAPGSFPGAHYGPPPSYPGYPGAGHHGQGPPQQPLAASNYGPSAIANQVPVNSSNYPGAYSGPIGGDFSGRLPPSSVGYPDSAQYGLTSSSLPTQHSQAPPVPRGPPGGMYQGLPHYY
ncbi:Splicing factor-like protein [Trema orientale]|uniref:Splicing factor-like protein n=1 Tax=Trema orientale TaxID=63057 RepID=A0A2P5DKP0_TREOI|nr:Splicing factor-like protein [Trema orientale]